MDWTEFVGFAKHILNFPLFELNQTPVTVSSILMFIIMMVAFFALSRILNRLLIKSLLVRLGVEESTRFIMLRVNHYMIMIIGAIISFQFIGINLSGLAVIFGLLSVGIGFGLQNVTSNFIAGLILLIERPIKISDRRQPLRARGRPSRPRAAVCRNLIHAPGEQARDGSPPAG